MKSQCFAFAVEKANVTGRQHATCVLDAALPNVGVLVLIRFLSSPLSLSD